MATIQLKTEIPGPKSKALMERRRNSVARGLFHTTPFFVAEAQGAKVTDVDGNSYIDFATGIGVLSVGHRNPKVLQAIESQTKKYLHTSFNVVAYGPYIELCERLNKKTPGNFAKKTFLANSGAEAVENAIKIARCYTGKSAVICFEHAFHGRTYMALTLTAKEVPYKSGFGPYNADIFRTPFPMSADHSAVEECFQKFEETIKTKIGIDKTAAVIIEPVLGEGGFAAAPALFMQKLQKFCNENKIVFIADEIQCGFGRTGTLFASEKLHYTPDITVLAKGLGGGMPISAVTGRAEIMDAPNEGGIGGTYGGNPVACATAIAVVDAFEDGKILQNVGNISEILLAKLTQWKGKFSFIGEVRGLGMMLALEMVKPDKTPNKELTGKIVKMSYERGLILMTAGTYGNIIRFLMPLTIETLELNEGLAVLEKVLHECA